MATGVAEELLRIVEAWAERLRGVSEAEAAATPAAGRWSKKEILGHLIDSATNNHQRFVRAQEEAAEYVGPRYEQEHWVTSQGYAASSWPELIEFWRLYNRHLAQVIKRIPAERLGVSCRIGPAEPVTLGFVVEDYLAHLKHHLRQIEGEQTGSFISTLGDPNA
ncbi:MAG TPA: DinB family protein [Pyrinomonadaceae bacterium]|nr:DinB family protein [Pyrinomonadaceae bacterium]